MTDAASESSLHIQEAQEPGNAIQVTDAAASKVRELIDEEGNPHLKLRIFINGGGCSGFQYNFAFEEEVKEDDLVVSKAVPTADGGYLGEIHLLVDPMSFLYLSGATIDYKNDINGERFVINNPHAKTTCGCGSSFDA